MKKLDSICSKLMSQNSAANETLVDQTPINAEEIIGDQQVGISSGSPDQLLLLSSGFPDQQLSLSNGSPDQKPLQERPKRSCPSPGSRPNKRKNFKPRIVRVCDEEAIGNNEEMNNGSEVEGRRYSMTNVEDDRVIGDNRLDDHRSDHSHKQDFTDDEETHLAIVEGEEDLGAISDHSSSSALATALTSSSTSPHLFLHPLRNATHPLSPSTIPSVSPQATSSGGHTRRSAEPAHQPGPAVHSNQSGANDQCPPFVSYIVRFMGNDCGAEQCRFATSREHFHCKLCNNKLFTKKEEMLRHYKWHRKREESLAYGFMRYSASDDCAVNFHNCVHNLRQTHYHCLQDGCDKVYISTSDVQMHANSHRKQAHIAKEGFQRVKGSEQCTYAGCPFADPSNRTTHFHCLRSGCRHSFKNKADMDKHKAHHTRDEQLTKDGFKKYMKSESCPFQGCAFSRVVNHIHCIRPGCDYVLHSTSQMYSHKRKHEKQDKRVNEYVSQQETIAAAQQDAIVKAFKSAAALMSAAGVSTSYPFPMSPAFTASKHVRNSLPASVDFLQHRSNGATDIPGDNLWKKVDDSGHPHDPNLSDVRNRAHSIGGGCEESQESDKKLVEAYEKKRPHSDQAELDDVQAMGIDMNTLQSPIQFFKSVTKTEPDAGVEPEPATASASASGISESYSRTQQSQQGTNGRSKGDDSWKKFITRYTANDPCVPLCPLLYKDHYHCTAGEGCKMTFKSKDGVRDHAKQHEQLCQAVEHFRTCDADEICNVNECPYAKKELHYHCTWNNCTEAIGSREPVFRRLEHHKVHEYSSQFTTDSSRSHSSFTDSSTTTITTSSNSISPKCQPATSGGGSCEQKRKRGRPPKYNVLDVNVVPSLGAGQSPNILVTSFKLQKTTHAAAAPSHALKREDQPVTTGQSRRGRPRTVSSPRHQSAAADDQALANAVALLQQQQLQQQWETLKQWSNDASCSRPGSTNRSVQSSDTKRPQFDGFTTYTMAENCPDSMCRYRGQLHYHCRLPRCFYSSSRNDQLELHRRDFHQAFEIPEGYACYDRSYNCRHASCQYNGQARHFHCQKAGCSAALLKFNQLAEHSSKGHEAIHHENQFGSSTQDPVSLDIAVDSVARSLFLQKSLSNNFVRSSGIFYPAPIGNDVRNDISADTSSVPPHSQPSNLSSLNLSSFAALAHSLSPAISLYKAAAAMGVPSTIFMPNTGRNNGSTNGAPTTSTNNPLYLVEQQCGRPFCKLKRRLHYHCALCQQGFSHFDRLSIHMQKHGVTLPSLIMQQSLASPPAATPTESTTAGRQQPAASSPRGGQCKVENAADCGGSAKGLDRQLGVQGTESSSKLSAKNLKFHVFQPKTMKFSDTGDGHGAMASSTGRTSRITKESNTSIGTTLSSTTNSNNKFSMNVDHPPATPAFEFPPHTGSAVQFKFVDFTGSSSDCTTHRTANSRRKLSPPDTAVAAASVSGSTDTNAKRPLACRDDMCPKKAGSPVHYHCEKCEFWTPESTKWHVHVKQHARMDEVAALGFKKVLGTGGGGETVRNGDLPNTKSSTGCPLSSECSVTNHPHYHCVTCNYTAFNHSQMSTHKTSVHTE